MKRVQKLVQNGVQIQVKNHIQYNEEIAEDLIRNFKKKWNPFLIQFLKTFLKK